MGGYAMEDRLMKLRKLAQQLGTNMELDISPHRLSLQRGAIPHERDGKQ
jgi:hypothetical protein